MTDRELIAEAVEIMLSAINSGDWKVDGACDPHASIIRLKNRLSRPEYEFECPRCGHCCQQREWVGLTEQDVHDAFNFTELIKQLSFDRDRPEWCENFAAYLEAKLKEKNT